MTPPEPQTPDMPKDRWTCPILADGNDHSYKDGVCVVCRVVCGHGGRAFGRGGICPDCGKAF